jgi:hypothetical protein
MPAVSVGAKARVKLDAIVQVSGVMILFGQQVMLIMTL